MHLLFSVLISALTTANAAVLQRQDQNLIQASLPQFSNTTARTEAINTKRQGWLYGPPLLGNTSFFPTGRLANATMQAQLRLFSGDNDYITPRVLTDADAVLKAVKAHGGLLSLDDYAKVLYDGQWLTSVPAGISQGILTNYTDDLLFSMERLSIHNFPLRRLNAQDTLPFNLDLNTTVTLTTLSLRALQQAGRLFVADHSNLPTTPKAKGKYSALSTAYFFIHPVSGDFLPLAIKTNVGSDLVYTPLDSHNDWLLAKILFNSNDLLHLQIVHLAATHDVAEIAHQAAKRTLSDEHPVMVLLDRLLTQAYAVRIAGNEILFNPGGYFDQAFPITSSGAEVLAAEQYHKGAGAFQANYLSTDLRARGLIDSPVGPPLKHFPFYDDAKAVRDVICEFVTTFVHAYYPTEDLVATDTELAAWFVEASTSAKAIDFPCAPKDGKPTICDRATLIELLTHMAYLTGVLHHAMNTGSPVYSSGTLPFHPAALYNPLPSRKNISSAELLSLLPPAENAVLQISLVALFNRPQYEAQNKTLVHMFSKSTFLAQFGAGPPGQAVQGAASLFKQKMECISRATRARKFDADGLSQGMPFVYRSLDPGTVPFFLAV